MEPDWTENMRVVNVSNVVTTATPDFEGAYQATYQQQRTGAQRLVDGILDDAEADLRAALERITEGLEKFGILRTPRHRDLPVLISQQIAEIVEERRLRQ